MDPKLFAGSGSRFVTWGYGSGFKTVNAPYKKSSKIHQKISKQFDKYDIKKKVNLTFSLKSML
jgi:hypothetical protein